MATNRIYAPAKVEVLVAGNYPVKSFAEGTSIQASRNTENSTSVVGLTGDVGHTVSADKTGTLSFTLMQTSPSNEVFSGIQNYQDINHELLRFNLDVVDPSGGFLCHAKGCHINNPPELNLGDSQETKVWSFFCEELIFLETGKLTDSASQVAQVKSIIDTVKSVNNSDTGNLV